MIKKIMQLLARAKKHASRRYVIAPVIIAVTALCITVSALSVETYVIHDGGETIVHTSHEKNAKSVLNKLDRGLGELDDVIVDKNEKGDTVLTILRSGTVTVTADGVQTTVEVRHDDTVLKALDRAQVTLGEIDEISCDKESTVQYGSNIVVARIAITETTKTVEIPYESETKKNGKQYVGYKKVIQEGVNGQKEQTVQVKTRDGVVVSEILLKETVITPAQNKIVEHGTKVSPNVIGGSGTITSRDGALRYTKVLDVVATAYSAEEHYTNQYTASGARARVGLIAVDPRVIPLGTRMYITSADGKSWVYGYAVAADTGGAIKGNKIDLYFDTVRECNKFGRRKAKVYILE